jgi:menaquinol-cytochrome c reductase iron-sulfur subunit
MTSMEQFLRGTLAVLPRSPPRRIPDPHSAIAPTRRRPAPNPLAMDDLETQRDSPASPCGCPEPPSADRRRFLARLSYAIGGLAAVLAGVPVIGFLFSPVRRREPQVWRDVGAVDDFTPGDTVRVTYEDPDEPAWAGYAGRSAAWLRRDEDGSLVAFSVYCTHTGCPVNWTPGAQLFMCPCHGGTFHRDGRVAAGPPPRALDRHEVRVRNGRVEVRTLGVPIGRGIS